MLKKANLYPANIYTVASLCETPLYWTGCMCGQPMYHELSVY